MAVTWPRPRRSLCPIASTLELVGDRWTLVIVRDMLTGKKRFAEFLASPEGVTTNVLTDRLARMEAAGLVAKTPYQKRPPRYEYALTADGAGLAPVVQAMCRWAARHVPDCWTPPESLMALTGE
ncbi:MAG: helix-turn-helix transcriptional regulator [Caulobacterales bacterium]|nr:helix-turn-helix transcriptional regulator [Caulobacterales bacterium]